MRSEENQKRIYELQKEIADMKFKINNKDSYRRKKKGGIIGIAIGGGLLLLGIVVYIIAFLFIPTAIEENNNAWFAFGGFMAFGIIIMCSSIIPFGIGIPNLVIGCIRYTKACNAEKNLEIFEEELKDLKNSEE